jgi:hypothetical protein
MSLAETYSWLAPRWLHDGVEPDPLRGEDEPWAEEAVLRPADEENFVGFLRTLWVAVFACAVFWVTIVVGAVKLLGVPYY